MSKTERFKIAPTGRYFDQLHTPLELPVVGEVYHWQHYDSAPIDKHADLPKYLKTEDYPHGIPLKVSDDWWSLADANSRCFKASVILRRPFVLLEQFELFEETFAEGRQLHWELVKEGGFDSVVYTPHQYSRGYRQAVLLEPLNQVLTWERFMVDSDELADKRKSLNADWARLMHQTPGCPYTNEQLREAEMRAMAHRYMYYVEASPIITDREYDLLDGKILPWLPADSPLQKPGSELEESYTEEQKRYARLLRVGKWLHEPPFVYIKG